MNKRFKSVVGAFCALLGSTAFATEIESSTITSDIENDSGENPYGTVCEMSVFKQTAATLKWCSLGTSITWYNDEPRPEVGLTHGYQDRTIEKLGLNKAANFINRGVSGARIGDANTEPPTGSPCDIYTLEWGINDWMRGTRVGNLEIFRRRLANPNDACEDITTEVWYTFAARYAGVITQIKAINPDAIIILMTPRKAFNNNNNLNNSMPAHWWDQSTPDSAQQEATYLYDYVKLIRAIGEEINCPVVDQFRYAANVENLESLSIDKALHPNDAGYEVMANLLAPVMSKAIEAKYGITRCTHGGTTSVVPGTAATCTEAGTTDKTVCTNPDCQMVLVPSETIPALGHDWGAWTMTTPATESATGMKERTCQRTGCNEKETLAIPRVGEVVALRNIAVVTKVGELPVLPAQVAGLRADGTVAGLCDVVWAEHSAPSAVGKTTIAGTAMVDGVGKSVTASVRATVEQSDDDIQNLVFGNPPTTAYPMSGISYPYASLNATAYANQVNGLYENNSFVWGGALGAAKDGDYNGKYAKEVFVFEFTLAKTSTVKGFTVWHMTDSGWLLDPYPAFVEVSADNGTTWTSVAVTGGARPKSITSVPTANGSASVFKYDYELASPAPSVTKLRLKFSPYGIETPEPGDSSNWKGLKISEIEVFGIEGESGGPLEPLTTDTLTALAVDNAPVEGFSPTTLSYSIDEALTITSATSTDNMGITILPRANGAAHVVTLSESGSTKTYTVEMPAACEHAHQTVTDAVAATCTTAGHTRSVYCEDCERYLEEAETIQALGHDWGAWTVTKEPSKTEAGYREHTCQRVDCGVTEGEDIPKLTDVVALRNVAVVTAVGTAPTLPAKVAGLKPNGMLGDEYDVVWESADPPSAAGITTVAGTAQVNGESMPVTASVRAAVASGGELVNYSPSATFCDATANVKVNDKNALKNGTSVIGSDNHWDSYICYNNGSGDMSLSLGWDSPVVVSEVHIYFSQGGNYQGPDNVRFFDDSGTAPVAIQNFTAGDVVDRDKAYAHIVYTFATPQTLNKIRFVATAEGELGNRYLLVRRMWVFGSEGGSGGSVDPLSSDMLTALSVDGTAVAGFAPTTYAYTVDNGEAITAATSTDNMGITILPKYDGTAYVVTFAEDAESTKTYSVAMPTVTVCLHEHTTTNGAVAATCTTAGSTGTVTCDDCHETVREPSVIPALGHDWGEWEVTKDATRTETGSRKRVCQRAGCGEEQTETIPMVADVVALRNVAVVTAVGTAPTLPAKVAGLMADGTTNGEYAVSWPTAAAPSAAGVTTVTGTAQVNGAAMSVTASVRAANASSGGGELVNVSPSATPTSNDPSAKTHSVPSLVSSEPLGDSVVWVTANNGNTLDLINTLTWDSPVTISKVRVCYSGSHKAPSSYAFSSDSSGASTIDFTAGPVETVGNHRWVEFTFGQPTTLSTLRCFFGNPPGWLIVERIWAYEAKGGSEGGSIDPLSSATLSALSVDGTPVAGFVPTTYAYTVENGEAITSATSTDNMGITILPKYNGAARVVTFAEDAESTKTYSVAMPTVTVCLHEHTTTNGAVAATCTTAGSTGTVTCDDCHEVVREATVVPALGHDWGEWEITLEPTESAVGSKRRECLRNGCDAEETAVIPMVADIVALRNVAVATAIGTLPGLPAQVAGLKADGTVDGEYEVVWEPAAAPTAAGVTTVAGTATVNGAPMGVTAAVRAAKTSFDGGELVNYSPTATFYDATANVKVNDKSALVNATSVVGSTSHWDSYICYNNGVGDMSLVLGWDSPVTVSEVAIYFSQGGNYQYPDNVRFYDDSGATPVALSYTAGSIVDGDTAFAHIVYAFDAPVTLSKIRFVATAQGNLSNRYLLVRRMWAYGRIGGEFGPVDPLSSDMLTTLSVDGTPVAGFAPALVHYTVEGGSAITAATSSDNMGITILPKSDGTAYVVTLAEDGESTKTYSVAMPAAVLKATVKVVDRTGKETTITKPLDEIVGAINGAVASAGYGSKVLLPALDMDYAVTLAPGVRVVKNADSTGTVTLVVPESKSGWYTLNAAGDAMVLSAGAVPVFVDMEVGEDSAVLTLGNAKAGLYYAIVRSETLFGFETAPVVATGAPSADGTVDFTIPLGDGSDAAFYKALVTDDPAKADDPRGNGGGEGGDDDGDDDPVDIDITQLTWCSLGTSVTDFNDDPIPGRTKGYQFFLMDELDWDRTKLINEGHSGTLISSSSTKPPETPCDIYTVEYGVNDWARGHDVGTLDDYKNPYYNGNAVRWDNFAACYRVLIDKIKAVNPNAVIILATPRKAYGSSSDSGTSSFPANCDDPTLPGSVDSYYNPAEGMVPGKQTYLKDYADLIKAIAAYEGFPVVDWYSFAATQENLASLSVDVAVHPNDAGYEIMAGLLKPVLLKAVQDRFGGGEEDDDEDPIHPAEYGPWNVQVLDPSHIVMQFDGSYGVEKNYVESGTFSTAPLSTEYAAIKNASFTVNGTVTAQAGHCLSPRGQMSYTNAQGQAVIVGGTNNGAWELRAVHNLYLTLASPLAEGENSVLTPDGRTISFSYGANTVSPLFKVNQVGYAASAAEKYVYLGGWMGTAGAFPLNDSYSFEIVDAASGTTALTGSFSKRMDDTTASGVALTGEKTLEANIGALTTAGTYYVRVAGIGRSMDFRVSDDAAADQFAVHMLGLYQQRCGCAKEEPYTHWTDDACHMKVYRGVHPSNDDEYQKCFGGTAQNAFSIIQANASSCTEELTLPGGWHDAADYDRRPYHLKVVIDLANTYLMRPQNFTDGQLAIPENANGIPDILDEADWGLRHLLAAQQADGGVGAWIETITHPDYGNQKMPSHDTDIFNYYLGRATHRSTLKYCGAAANLARALYAANTPASNARADVYKASAVAAWNYVMNTARQTNVAMKGPNNATVYYSEPTWYDPYEYAKAAINLGVITGDSSYFNHLSDQITYRGGGADNYNYGDTGPYAVSGFFSVDWSCISRDESFGRNGFILSELGLPCAADSVAAYQTIKTGWVNRVKANANEILASMPTAMPYRNASLGLNKMAWGQCLALRNAEWLCAAHFFTGDAKYLKAAQLASDFQSGCNPCGATWTSGLGTVYPVAYLSLHSFADRLAEYMPGITPYHNTGADFGYLFNATTKGRYTTYQTETGAKPWWRRFEVGENMSIGVSEYTVTETIGPCAATSGYLINPGHTAANLTWKQPAKTLADLPGYWALP